MFSLPASHQPPALPSADAVSWARGHPSHPDTSPNIYEGGLGAQQQCPSAQGSKPKNFRLRHLRGLGLYLPGHMQPAGQCESHWLGQLKARSCLPRPEGMAWPLDLPHRTLGPGDNQCSVLLEAQVPRDSLGNPGEAGLGTGGKTQRRVGWGLRWTQMSPSSLPRFLGSYPRSAFNEGPWTSPHRRPYSPTLTFSLPFCKIRGLS